MIFKANWGFNW